MFWEGGRIWKIVLGRVGAIQAVTWLSLDDWKGRSRDVTSLPGPRGLRAGSEEQMHVEASLIDLQFLMLG